MAITYLKTARSAQDRADDDAKTRAIVESTLKQIETGGDAAVRELSEKFDNYSPTTFRLTKADIADLIAQLTPRELADIKFAQEQVRNFARAQRGSMLDIEVETLPGVILGHKNIPVQSVGCYVPGGKFPMVASAHMSVATASVAGVPRIIASTPPFQGKPNPGVIAATHIAGADRIMALGGVQGIAAMAFGLFGLPKADILVGPGNQFVAEAKRILFGRVGIDMVAGPTDSLVLADATADPLVVATDLVGQAEHGYNSPVWLVTDDRSLAEKVMGFMDGLIADLPELNRQNAEAAWRDYGEVILCENREEMVATSDDYAPEHLKS